MIVRLNLFSTRPDLTSNIREYVISISEDIELTYIELTDIELTLLGDHDDIWSWSLPDEDVLSMDHYSQWHDNYEYMSLARAFRFISL